MAWRATLVRSQFWRGAHVSPRLLFVALLALAVAASAADAQSNKSESVLTGIAMTTMGDGVAVTIDISGSSAAPSSGLAEGRPRVYLDFKNVRPAVPLVTASSDPRIVRVRTAVHSSQPLVTRVVVELTARMPYRVAQDGNRTTVFLGAYPLSMVAGTGNVAPAATAKATPPAAVTTKAPPLAPLLPVPALPDQPKPAAATPGSSRAVEPAATPAAPPLRSTSGTATTTGSTPVAPVPPPLPASSAPAPSAKSSAPASSAKPPASTRSAVPTAAMPRPVFTPPVTPPVSKDLEKYQRQASGVIDRLLLQKPLLVSLDGKEEQAPDRLQIAAQEFERLRQELVAIKPPDTLRRQHDLLIQSSTLGLMAVQLRLQSIGANDTNTARNAMSAAAGALLILNRACADLLCQDSR